MNLPKKIKIKKKSKKPNENLPGTVGPDPRSVP